MAITPTHFDSFRSASPSSIPPAAETLTGTLATPASEAVPQTAFHRRFFGTEIEERLTSKLVLVQDALTKIVNDASANVVEKVDSGTLTLGNQIVAVDDRVKPVVGEIDKVNNSVGNDLAIQVNDLVPRIDSVSASVGANLGAKVSALVPKLDGLSASVGANLEARVLELLPKLDAVSTSVGANLGAQVSALGPKIDSASAAVKADLQEHVDAIGLRLDAVTTSVATQAQAVGQELAKLTQKVCNVETAIGDSKLDLGRLLDCMGQIKACVDDLKKQLCEPAEPPGGAPKPKKP